jgi:hypothetical protein
MGRLVGKIIIKGKPVLEIPTHHPLKFFLTEFFVNRPQLIAFVKKKMKNSLLAGLHISKNEFYAKRNATKYEAGSKASITDMIRISKKNRFLAIETYTLSQDL